MGKFLQKGRLINLPTVLIAPLPKPPHEYVPSKRKQHEIDSIPLDEEAALYLTKLPDLHKDPFDRILICQAIVAGFIILTPFELITQHPLRSLQQNT